MVWAPVLGRRRRRRILAVTSEAIVDEALELSLKCMNLGAEGSRLVPAYRLRIDCLFRQAAALDPVAYGKQIKHSGVVGHAHGHVVLDANPSMFASTHLRTCLADGIPLIAQAAVMVMPVAIRSRTAF